MFFLTRIRRQEGLTLIEILIVLAIIVIIAGVGVPQLAGLLEKGKADAARAEVETMGSAIREVKKDTGFYVENLDQLGDTSSSDEQKFSPWWGPYVSSLPTDIKDPWGTEYVYFYWDTEDDERDVHLGDYPPGPPGGGWEQGQKTGWKGKPLPPGLWKKIEGIGSPSEEGFLLFSYGPDKKSATPDDMADDIVYGAY